MNLSLRLFSFLVGGGLTAALPSLPGQSIITLPSDRLLGYSETPALTASAPSCSLSCEGVSGEPSASLLSCPSREGDGAVALTGERLTPTLAAPHRDASPVESHTANFPVDRPSASVFSPPRKKRLALPPAHRYVPPPEANERNRS